MRRDVKSYSVTVRGCKEMKDPPNTFYLYPGVSLYYELVVREATSGAEWSVLRRFSEVKKFWDAVRPAAGAVGAPIDPFPPASAFMTGDGVTGNLYETNPNSDFASDRVQLLRKLMNEFSAKTDTTGGSLFDLKLARAFFDIDDRKFPKRPVVDERPWAPPPPTSNDRAIVANLTRSTPAAFFTVFVLVLAALYAFAGN